MAENNICKCKGDCFAKVKGIDPSRPKCDILKTGYTHDCPFQKPERDKTNGVWYPYNPNAALEGYTK